MKIINIFSVWICVLLASGLRMCAQGSAFTYQGRLNTVEGLAQGVFDFTFALHAHPLSDTPIGSTVHVDTATVSNGLFSVSLDFGAAAFNGGARWLQVALRPAGKELLIPLAPRQPIAPTPYALFALNSKATLNNLLQGLHPSIGGGSQNYADADFPTIGGGFNNRATGNRATVGGGEQNVSTARYATVAGRPSEPGGRRICNSR
jgi:hypothetical protein